MKKSVRETEKKLQRLSNSLGDIEVTKSRVKPTFMTSEVIVLLILTAIVSVVLSGLVTYNFLVKGTEKVDDEVQEFLDNYNYIVDNYYGEINKSELLDAALAGMMNSLDAGSAWMGSEDSNFNIYLEGSYEGIGIEIYSNDDGDIVVGSVFEDTPADKAGIKTGDIILKVQGEDVHGKDVNTVSDMMAKGETEITYKRDDEEKTVKLKKTTVELKSVNSSMFDNNIGYMEVSIFANNTTEQFKKQLGNLEDKNMRGLVIDLRGNSGGHLTAARDILSLFLDSSHPIYKIKSKTRTQTYYSSGKETKNYGIVLLVDENSASASEIVTSALQEQYGATVVGVKTFGKGTVQELQTLPDGQQYKLTTTTWLTSKGKSINKKGIEPDVNITLSDEYIKNPTLDNDNQLQKALEILEE